MRSRIGLKALGLSALVLALMAISASGAQGAAEWMKAGANIGSAEPEIKGVVDTPHLTLLTKINGLDIDVLCTFGAFVGVKLKAGGTSTNGKVKFVECDIVELLLDAMGKVIGEHLLECHLHTSGAPAGTIETKSGHAQLELHEGGVPITLIVPEVGEEFARLLTEGCVLPETIPVIGKLALKDCEGKAEVEQAKHLVEEGPLSELFVINKTNMEHLAKIDGSVWVELTAGGNWSGLAG